MNKINSFYDLVEISPDHIKTKLERLKTYSENILYHPEANVYEHIRIVVERLIQTDDIDLILAGLYHDISKLEACNITFEKTGLFRCFGHEKLAVDVILADSDFIENLGGNIDSITYIVENHMRVKSIDEMSNKKANLLKSSMYFNKLLIFSKADNMLQEFNIDIIMGGNALKTVKTRRCDKVEFDMISSEVISLLDNYVTNIGIPLFYNNKTSFGDIDIICVMNKNIVNVRTIIEDVFKPGEIYHNGNCYSFNFREVQIDLITTSSEHYNSYYNYLCYNDLGNFQGGLTHQFKFDLDINGDKVKCILKYGQIGLFVRVFYDNFKYKLGDFIISDDLKLIHDFLDLDHEKYLNGFDELIDIFNFIIESKYFSYDIFQLKNLNKVNRERNLKRKSYMLFLDIIENHNNREKYKYDNEFIIGELTNRFESFDNVIDTINNNLLSIKRSELVKSKFNGNLIKDNFDVTGKAIGELICGFKQHINEFDEFILSSTKDEILDKIRGYIELK